MFYHSIEFWEHIMDIGIFCIFGFTLLYLIISEIAAGRRNASKKRSKKKRNFNEDIKEQLDKMDSTQPMLQENIHKKHQNTKQPESKDTKQPGAKNTNQPEPIADYASTVDSYGEASKMVDSGMSIKAIREKVKIPVCEIELIIKLRKLINESNKNSDGYAQALF